MFNDIADLALEAVSGLLAFFYELPVIGGNYGLAIMMLTIAVMVVLMPLTLKATRSTIKMTQLQPHLRELQKKHKDDRQALNQEMMALYQRHGVNPIGGCLPMLAQLPVFLLLFNVLRGLSRRVNEKPYFALSERARELVGAGVDPSGGETFDPKYLSKTSQLYQDLSQETEIGFGPFDLSAHPWDVLTSNPVRSIPYLLLIAFVVASSYYQQKQISARRGAVPDNPTPQQQTQQQLLRILPLMSGVWSFAFPAGLVLYWATSNLFRIGQQAYITRALYSEEAQAELAIDEAALSSGSGSGSGSKSDTDGDSSDDSDGSTGGGKRNGKAGGRAKDRAGSARNGNDAADGSSGRNGSNGAGPKDRNEAWAERRAARAKTKSTKKPSSSDGGSSRTTPKGTKPTASKKKKR